MISPSQLFDFRACRQFLAPESRGRTPEDVLAILRALQPFPPIGASKPGVPPHPRQRVVAYQDDWSQRWRLAGHLVKGRFMKGNVAYVVLEDLDLYAAAFRLPLGEYMPIPESTILSTLERSGAQTKNVLRNMTGLENRRFDRAMLTLNRAFEIMELQREENWSSPWDLYRRAFPQASPEVWEQAEAQSEVLRLFTRGFGPATIGEMADWSSWNKAGIRSLVDRLLTSRSMTRIKIEAQAEPAYLASEDVDALFSAQPGEPFLVILDSSDPMVMPQWTAVGDRYRTIPYPYCWGVIVIDGAIRGAAWGHYRRQFIQIEILNLDGDILNDPSLIDNVLSALEAHVGARYVPVHIFSINEETEAPWVRDILKRNGYAWESGYYVKHP